MFGRMEDAFAALARHSSLGVVVIQLKNRKLGFTFEFI